MRSTLPQIFKHKEHELSPRKQGGIFELDLYSKELRQSYKTKLINPHLNREGPNIPKTFFRKKPISGQRYDQTGRRSVSLSYQSKSVDLDSKNIQQSDNVKVNIRKLNKQIQILKSNVQGFEYTINLAKNELKGVEERREKGIQVMEQKTKAQIERLRQMLSELRRQTGMEVKVNKKTITIINEDLIQSCEIIKDIQNHRVTIKDLNF